MTELLAHAVIYLAAAVIAVPLASGMGLGSVLGYLLAGLVIGPVLGFVGNETQDLQHFAEFGVVMMLFVIGLELTPRTLWDMRHRLIGLGGMQISGTILLISAAGYALGLAWQSAIAVGMILSLSSTAIVLQTMTEKGLMQTSGGRSSFAVLLTQDIAVIPMLALLPLLSISAPMLNPDGSVKRTGIDTSTGHSTSTLLDGLPGWAVTISTLGVIAAIALAGIYLMRPVFRYIHVAHLREMYTALALLIVAGIGYLMNLVGLSPALGTFLAGVVLANSEFRHELESDIEPFKGLLLGLFFITVGAGINVSAFLKDPLIFLGLTLGIITIKAAVLFAIAVIFKIRGRNRWLFSLSLAQAGEFGFVLLSFSVQLHVLPKWLGDRLLMAVALSMLVTPLLFILYEMLQRLNHDTKTEHEPDTVDTQGPVIIAGIGRFGQIVNRLVRNTGFETVVLDNDMRTIQLMRQFGIKGFFGDPSRPEILKAAGLAQARVLVVALDDPEKATMMVQYARRERPKLHIIARARDRNHVFALYKAGANDIVRELFDSSLRAGRYALENLGLTDYEASVAENAFYQHDRHALLELAQVWRADVPAHENSAYVARAKELEQELEASLLAALDGTRKADQA
jgi:CPA2 family monovalent cation:H+ antiporter-2